MSKAILLEANGDITVGDLDTSLRGLQSAVEGMIEMVQLGSGAVMWVNEEGKLLFDTVNTRASFLYLLLSGIGDVIMGNAIITGMNEQGDIVDLTEKQIGELEELVNG